VSLEGSIRSSDGSQHLCLGGSIFGCVGYNGVTLWYFFGLIMFVRFCEVLGTNYNVLEVVAAFSLVFILPL
jgi:hypothetical protein